MAQDPRYVRFTSVVLDTCDGARNIIETPDDWPRWGNVGHYHLDDEYRDEAKEALEFRQVPFYVVLNEDDDIVQKGGREISILRLCRVSFFRKRRREKKTVILRMRKMLEK